LRPHDPYDAPIKYTGRYTREPLRGHDHRRVEHVIREIAVATPGRLTQDDLKYMVDMYDANLRYVDDMVGQFYAALKKSGVTDDTLIVLMSDHGEAFMEHGELGHNTRAYEEMVHVPLAIIGPRGHGIARGAYGGLVDLVDLMPTFQELFGLDAPSPYPGRSLAGVLRGGTDSPRTRSISRSAVEHYRVAYREGDMKLIATVDAGYREVLGVELYDLGKDPGERNDLSEHVPLAGPLLEKLKEHLAQLERKDSTHDPVLSAEEKEQLESIGYGKSE
jgi:arylsulfatase A-like enzyme